MILSVIVLGTHPTSYYIWTFACEMTKSVICEVLVLLGAPVLLLTLQQVLSLDESFFYKPIHHLRLDDLQEQRGVFLRSPSLCRLLSEYRLFHLRNLQSWVELRVLSLYTIYRAFLVFYIHYLHTHPIDYYQVRGPKQPY